MAKFWEQQKKQFAAEKAEAAEKKAQAEAAKKAKAEAEKKAHEDGLAALAADLEPQFEEVFAEELTSPHQGKLRQGIKYTNKMPDNLRFSEFGYDPRADNVTRDYRAMDVPRMTHGFNKKTAVCLSFLDDDDDPLKLEGDPEEAWNFRTYGQLGGHELENFIKMRFLLDTQYPSIELSVKREGGKIVSFRVFANSFLDMDGKNGKMACMEWGYGDGLNSNYVDTRSPLIVDAFNHKTIGQVILGLQLEGRSNSNPRLETRRPIITGDISEQEVLSFVSEYRKAYKAGTLNDFSRPDAVIAKIYMDSWIVISRPLAVRHREEFDITLKFYESCLNMCVIYGNLWFYTRFLKKNQSVLDLDKIWTEAPVPRWLVNEWAIQRNDKREIVGAIPSKWTSFRPPGVFPDIKTAATAHVLALARGVNTLTATIQDRLSSSDEKTGLFDEMFGQVGKYSVQISCNLQESLLTGQSLIPEIGTPLRISFRDSDNKTWVFNGTVVPTFNTSSWVTFSAVVVTAGTLHHDFKDGWTKNISIQLLSDNKSIGRQYVGFKEASRGTSREKGWGGPDFPRIFLDAPPQVSDAPSNPFAHSITKQDYEEFMNTIRGVRRANAGQAKVAELLLTDENGACVLIAPPGTGKTRVAGDMISTVFSLAKKRKQRHPILVCAPANLAVDEIFNKMLVADPSLGGMNAIRFRGGRMKPPKKESSEDELTRQIRSIADDWWDAMEYMACADVLPMKFGDREYHVNFAKTIAGWARKGSTHPQAIRARQYQGIQRELMVNHRLTSAKRKELKQEHLDLEAFLQSVYFQTVDVVFVTLNSASHEGLVNYYRPKLLIADEAAMATLGDFMTSVVPFWNDLHHSIFIGDPNQQRGRAMAPGQNEFSLLQRNSFMAKVQDEAGKFIKLVHLEEQFRMHKEISGPVNQIFYNGKLKDHPSTNDVKAIRTTAVDYFTKTFGAAYKGWFRFGVASDHSSRNRSELFMETTSTVNMGEADTLLRMVKGLLEHNPPKDGVRIQHADIFITTPYTGMCVHLWMESRRMGLASADGPQIHIRSVAGSQGQEGNIQFISFCVNDDKGGLDRLKFVAEKHGLNALMSRAKYMQICVGNFLDWTRAVKKGDNKLFTFRKSGLYHFGQVIESFWPTDNADDCTIIDSADATNALFNGKPSIKANGFAARVTFAPKRKNADQGKTELEKGKYGKDVVEQPSKKKTKRSRAPRNMTEDELKLSMKPLSAEHQKLLDKCEQEWKGRALLDKDYMAKQREMIKSSNMSQHHQRWFALRLNKIYQDRAAAAIAEGMAKLNTGSMTLEQCMSHLNTIPKEDYNDRAAFIDSLPHDMQAKVRKACEAVTKKKLANAAGNVFKENDIDWSEGDINPDHEMADM